MKKGRNVVAVLVKSFGCKTFKDNSVRGGFVAWGELPDGRGGKVDFATAEDSPWKVCKCEAFYPEALKMSFALDAIDIFDQGKALAGWETLDFDDRDWRSVTELQDQEEWGTLKPRTIPFMELSKVHYRIARPVNPLSDQEVVHGFSVAGPHFHGEEQIFEGRDNMALAVATWIHSPKDQTVVAGLFWGSYYLNGVLCEAGTGVAGLRKNVCLKIKEGWNAFFAVETFLDDCYNFMMALPRSAGLQLSPNKRYDDGVAWVRTPILGGEFTEDPFETNVPVPWDDSFDAEGGWIQIRADETDSNPARRSMWDLYGSAFEHIGPGGIESHVFRKSHYPFGFSLLLEFDCMQLVLPRIAFSGVAGATIDFAYGEHLSADENHLQHTIVYQAGDRVIASEDKLEFMTSQPRGARYMRITVRGAGSDVCVDSLVFLSCRYPVNKLGRFECSDPLLNEVWAMCERTQHANMEDVFVDCSGRERGMYLRDTIIQFHNTLAAYGDTKLMGRCMELFGQSPDETGKFRAVYPNKGDYTISDFAIEAIDGYWQYYLNTGDIERIRTDWPAMLGSIDWFNGLSDERKDGLLDADWPKLRGVKAHYGGLHGDNGVSDDLMDKSGPNANLTFPYLQMLGSAAKIARVLGEIVQAEAFETRRQIIAENARRLFWNEQKGCFNDNIEGRTQSFQASILAVLSEVATPSQVRSIRNWLNSEFKNVFINGYSPDAGAYFSPAYSFFIFQGLYELGLADLAESLMREGWGWMLASGAVTTYEFFRTTASHCHAWSANPMYFLSKNALGVSFPAAPDFSQVKVDIQSGLDWAKGAYPIPGTRQLIEVEWKRNEEGAVEADVKAPAGVRITWDRSKVMLRQSEEIDSTSPNSVLTASRRAV
ncbi:hypothetical protein QEH56_03150 [Pelagicoccus enzymogenes]|uniref:alpha-L-rhamnosidase-related protein n=1 Tax=Pelagicoccus enzymogenes TaxID=2773457 RepID=UPI00280CD906|nr:hypothetical protein [Pelagicoccus enzymogenes]MDQ8197125.1 hypothetical protein [Pelagicoccus enzymogenes]